MAKVNRCKRCGCKIEQEEGVSVKFVAKVMRAVNHRPYWVWDSGDVEHPHGHWETIDTKVSKEPTTIESFYMCKACGEQTIQFIIGEKKQ